MKYLLTALLLVCTNAFSQNLPSRWDELVASDWTKAMAQSGGVCILPIGILEKHGPHAPMGSDLIHVREWAARATKKEYAVVFPDYYYGQIRYIIQPPLSSKLHNEIDSAPGRAPSAAAVESVSVCVLA